MVKKNILGTTFTLFIFVCSMFAGVLSNAAVVYAANGDGVVVMHQVDDDYPTVPPEPVVQSEDVKKGYHLWLENNGDACINDIIITFPDTWQNSVNLGNSYATNMNTVLLTKEADGGDWTSTVANDKSLRIIPTDPDGVPLCKGGTTHIYVAGLKAPLDAEVSDIEVLTGDVYHDEPSDNWVRQPIALQPQIQVTGATRAQVKYLVWNEEDDLVDSGLGNNLDYALTVESMGAWAKMRELYVWSDDTTTVDVYMDLNNDGIPQGSEQVGTNLAVTAGEYNTLKLTNMDDMDSVGQVVDGYIRDAEQGGSPVTFLFDVAGTPSLVFWGHKDKAADLTIDPTRGGTRFQASSEGSVIGVEDQSFVRFVIVQLVEKVKDANMNNIWINAHDKDVAMYFSTDLSTFGNGQMTDVRETDKFGQVEAVYLEPNTEAGLADVEICFPDPFCTHELVEINAGYELTCELMMDQTVEAGTVAPLSVYVYDQFGNLVTNKVGTTPNRALIEYMVLSGPDGYSLDNDDVAGDGDEDYEAENANLGLSTVELLTSGTVGDHVVTAEMDGVDCGEVTVTGVLGQGDAIDCVPIGLVDHELLADQGFDVEVYALDMNGNKLMEWHSVVEINLEGTDKHIVSTTLQEEVFINSQHVLGKLNNYPDAPASAVITIDGCDHLGQWDLICNSDTLEEDVETFDVINSELACIDVVAEKWHGCSDELYLDTYILDTCGNRAVDLECNGGSASSCVDIEVSDGVINGLDNTETVCVDLTNTGKASQMHLDLGDLECGEVTVTATDIADCCLLDPDVRLPQCSDLVLTKLGDAVDYTVSVYPAAENQEDYYVDELINVEFQGVDACDRETRCVEQRVHVEVKGDDCVETDVQVDSPVELLRGDNCYLNEDTPIYKVVMENCADPVKDWTDINNEDLIVDKFLFEFDGPTDNVEICVYEETEESAGFQANEDIKWACGYLDSSNQVYNYAPGKYWIELDPRISMFQELYEYDRQLSGGARILPQDTKDFYFVMSAGPGICGIYDMDYIDYQDYQGPDFVTGGSVRDGQIGTETQSVRNDDYVFPDWYPVHSVTPGYGFGDRMIYSVINGLVQFRDTTSESVEVWVNDVLIDTIFINPQPATQVVALNHGDLSEPQICAGPDFEYVEDPIECWSMGLMDGCMRSMKDPEMYCELAMACSDEGYDVNLQVADGFQNKVAIENTEVVLDSCMLYPKYFTWDHGVREPFTVDLWQVLANYRGIDLDSIRQDPRALCMDMDEFRSVVKYILNDMLDTDDYFATMFAESTEFTNFVNEMFADKEVYFEGASVQEVDGKTVVYTDTNGQATFVVKSDDASLFNIQDMTTSFRVFTIPYNLDADYFDLAFKPGEHYQYDIMAVPEVIVGDGEQESTLFVRKLDMCGNPLIVDDEQITVSVDGSAIISRDFSGENNYDQEVTGYFSHCGLGSLFFGSCGLTVLNDVVEEFTVTVVDASGEDSCEDTVPPSHDPGVCESAYTETNCVDDLECLWVAEGDLNQPDTLNMKSIGAPVQLKITEIKHSDLLVEGGWLTVEVQDAKGIRVPGYNGDGLANDPGDVWGMQDNVFENICIGFDDSNAMIEDYNFGWFDLNHVGWIHGWDMWCGDLAFGKGQVRVAYDGKVEQTESVKVGVFDNCHDGNLFDDSCLGQEYNENNMPDSETNTRLTPDYGQLDFVGRPTHIWLEADKYVVAADGQDYAEVVIRIGNDYYPSVRVATDVTLQSSLLGTHLESDAVTEECYYTTYDALNPTSITVTTEECSGGVAVVRVSSTQAGTTQIVATGEYGEGSLYTGYVEIEFKQAFQNKIELVEGWNFFSVPVELAPGSKTWGDLGLDSVCTASAAWNEATQSWVVPGAATVVEPMEGYWCKTMSATSIDVTPLSTGTVYLPKVKTIYPGWNDVGLSNYVEMKIEHALISIDDIYSQVLDWVESLQRYLPFANTGENGGGNAPGTTGTGDMEAGQGYFIYASEGGSLAGFN